MRVSEIRVKRIRVNQGLGVLTFPTHSIFTMEREMRKIWLAIYESCVTVNIFLS